MRVISIGSDRNMFQENSEVRRRIIEYGALVEEMHIIVFATGNPQVPSSKFQVSENVWVYPTNSLSRWLYILDAYKIAKRIMRDSQFVIHNSLITAQDPFESGFAGWLAARKFGAALQLQIHTDFLSPYFSRESLLNAIRVRIAKFLLPRASGIRVVSERIKQSLKNKNLKLKTEPTVLPIFVDIKKIQSAKIKIDLHKKYPDNDFIILMASRLTREKNIGLAIEAMKEILTHKPSTLNPLLLIVGDGPERANYESRITNYGLQNNVIIEGWMDDLVSYYKTADIFLLTSNYEGYGRTVVEAMAAGLPVIMTDVGLAGEILVDKLDGLIVSVGGKTALASAIQELIENKEKRNSLVTESQKVIHSLSDKKEYLENYKNSFSSSSLS